MKFAAIAIVLGAAGATQAQVSGFSDMFRMLKRDGKLFYKQDLSAELKQLPPKVSPMPDQPDDTKVLELVHYGEITVKRSQIELSDGAEILARGFRCLADSIKGDSSTEIYTCSGNVRIIGVDETISGESVTINLKNKTFFATYGKAQIKPNLLNNQLKSDAFLSGKEASGSSKKIFGKDTSFTTCDLVVPHFHLDAQSSTIEPSKEAILRKVKIVILGKTVVTVPILWIPLGERSFKYLPQVGQSADEGFYVKNIYGFPMRGEDRGAVRLDYMSKLGVGIGANYYYRNATMNGITKIYSVTGNLKTMTINNQHEQRFKWGKLTLDNDIQQNNYLTAPSSTLVSTRAQLKFPRFTTLTFNQQKQSSSGFNNSNQTITLSDARQWGKTSTTVDMTLNRSGSSSGSTGSSRQTMDLRLSGNRDVKKGVFSLEYQRTIPIGEVTNFFPSSDKTPVLSFRTDSTKIFGADSFKTLPFRTEFSVGEYLDPILKRRVSRGMFDFNINRSIRDKGPWKWDFNGGFKQNVYSDDTAQYRIAISSGASYSLGKKLGINFRYSSLRPFGYSPLAIDRTGTSDMSTMDLSFMKNSKSSFGIQTGYDFVRSGKGEIAWQQVGLRSEYRVGGAFSFRTLSTYDTFRTKWSNIRLDSVWQSPLLLASVSARYDAIQSKWASVSAFIEGIEIGKTKFGTALNYNGYTKKFDSQQYNLIYDLHCAEAVFTVSDFGSGFRSGREIGFFIRLKSIPVDSGFGRGRLGNALGSGSGRDF
jgi:LPS-assembly protein